MRSACFSPWLSALPTRSPPKPRRPRAAPQKIDAAYTAKIKEYTTEPFFLTELVDHLPASDTVPSPEKVLGYVIGTPNKLTYTKDINRYMRELEKASKRVKVFSIGRSEEGREMLLVAVSDEANIAQPRSLQGNHRPARRPAQDHRSRRPAS